MHKIAALVEVDPKKAKTVIKEAFKKAGASRADAAQALGMGRAAFARWVERLELGAELEALEERAKRAGWHHGRVGGRPSK